MDFKLLGAVLLIVGTSIGAGMLGLPIACAQLGFIGSLLLLFGAWFIMTAGALLILEVNLWLPRNNNLISMARATLGLWGQLLSWVIYLLLLYSLLCAYIAGGSDLFDYLLTALGLDLPAWVSALIFTLLFSSIVYLGIHFVDHVNRWLMLLKFIAYFILVFLLAPQLAPEKLLDGNLSQLTSRTAITVTICSFGYATIIPSLRVYFAGNIPKLKKAIIIGSLIPLLFYILWDLVIMGVIPLAGSHGLQNALSSPNPNSALLINLSLILSNKAILSFAKLFTSICVLTSFLSVSLCLSDFFADAFKVEKKSLIKLLLHFLTFLPALVLVIFLPKIFIQALSYAGLYSIILLILLPAWMAWKGRYHRKLARGSGFRLPGGKVFLAFLILLSLALIIPGFI